MAPRIKLSIPTGQWPKPEGYPDALATEREIADHIQAVSPGDIDEDMVRELFQGCSARLAWIPIDQIIEGPAEQNIPNKRREAGYRKLPIQEMPPIVIDEGHIQDGHHRFRVAKAAGATGMWCYCIQDEREED